MSAPREPGEAPRCPVQVGRYALSAVYTIARHPCTYSLTPRPPQSHDYILPLHKSCAGPKGEKKTLPLYSDFTCMMRDWRLVTKLATRVDISSSCFFSPYAPFWAMASSPSAGLASSPSSSPTSPSVHSLPRRLPHRAPLTARIDISVIRPLRCLWHRF